MPEQSLTMYTNILQKNLTVNVLDYCVGKQHFFIVCVLKALYFL